MSFKVIVLLAALNACLLIPRSGSPWGWSPWLPFFLNMDPIAHFFTCLGAVHDELQGLWILWCSSGRWLIWFDFITRQWTWLNSSAKLGLPCSGHSGNLCSERHSEASQSCSTEVIVQKRPWGLGKVHKQNVKHPLQGFLLSGISSFDFQLLWKPPNLSSGSSTSKMQVSIRLLAGSCGTAWGQPALRHKDVKKRDTHSTLPPSSNFSLSNFCLIVIPFGAFA